MTSNGARMRLTSKTKQIDTRITTRERRLSPAEVADRSEDLANTVLEITLTEDTFNFNAKAAKDLHKNEIQGLEDRRDKLAAEVSKKRETRNVEALVVVDAETRQVFTIAPTQAGEEAIEAGLLTVDDIDFDIIDKRTARADELQEDLL